MKKILVSLSGGIDSCVALALALKVPNAAVDTVSFHYGSKHNPHEINAACDIAKHYRVKHRVMKLNLGHAEGALLDNRKEVPEGHYQAETMRDTVVPGRNTVIAAHLLSIAEAHKYDQVWLGIHQGDHHIYPDCRPEWFGAMCSVFYHSSEGKVSLQAPLLSVNKQHIVDQGLMLKAPLRLTRTCYKGEALACGKCGSCQERLEAFSKCGVSDPIEYAKEEKPKLTNLEFLKRFVSKVEGLKVSQDQGENLTDLVYIIDAFSKDVLKWDIANNGEFAGRPPSTADKIREVLTKAGIDVVWI